MSSDSGDVEERRTEGVPDDSAERLSGSGSVPAETRLNRMESAIGELMEAVRSMATAKTSHVQSSIASPSPRDFGTTPEDTWSSNSGDQTPDLNNALSAFSQTLQDLQSLKAHMPYTPSQLDGDSSLRDFSEALDNVYHRGDDVRRNIHKVGRSSRQFHVPDEAEGQALMQLFLYISKIGYPLYLPPSESLLTKIVYNPEAVEQRGWVVLFNCLCAVATPAVDNKSSILRERLKWNCWLALDDCRVFLEPQAINVLALVTIAMHGEDFATPNLSWIIIGHACRIAQTMNIHLPLQNTTNDEQMQRSLLFWSLFMVDISASLAFERPSYLSSPIYDRIPLPSPEVVAKFKPHTNSESSSFGGIFFLQSIVLGKLYMKALNFLQSMGYLTHAARQFEKNKMQGELSLWNNKTTQLLANARSAELGTASQHQLAELDIGMTSMSFRYHHLHVVLSRHDESDRSCLQSARAVITLLEKLVSNSSSVYNGTCWQLLYYPFTPFFVLFGNIISNPLAPTAGPDVLLLYATEAYLIRMNDKGAIAARLVKIANVFASLAENYVRETMKKYNSQDTQSQMPVPMLSSPSEQSIGDVSLDFDLVSDELDTGYLNWLSLADPSYGDVQLFASTGQAQAGFDNCMVDGMGPNAMFNPLGGKSLQRPLECNFDWFSWDMNTIENK